MSEKWSDYIEGGDETDRSWIFEESINNSCQQSQASVKKECLNIMQVREQVIKVLREIRKESSACIDLVSVFYHSLNQIIPLVLNDDEMLESFQVGGTEKLANKICTMLFMPEQN
jgi:hypothetical protein